MATDLRASVSLIIAGLAAARRDPIGRVYHLDRGFERIEEKLRQMRGPYRAARRLSLYPNLTVSCLAGAW